MPREENWRWREPALHGDHHEAQAEDTTGKNQTTVTICTCDHVLRASAPP